MSAPAASAAAALRARRRPRLRRIITRISGYEKQEFVLQIVQPSLVGMIDALLLFVPSARRAPAEGPVADPG